MKICGLKNQMVIKWVKNIYVNVRDTESDDMIFSS